MKIHVLHENLLPALSTLVRVVALRPTLPILQNISLRTIKEKSQIELKATNLDIGINTVIPAEIETEGHTTIPAKLFFEFVNSLKAGSIHLENKEGMIHIQTESSKATLPTMDPEEFPETTDINSGAPILISAGQLLENLPLVSFATATDESRPVITGVLFLFEGQNLTLVSADGYRLTERRLDITTSLATESTQFIIPGATIRELLRVISKTKETDMLEFQYDPNQIIFSYKGTEIVSRLLSGQYPDYKQIIPNGFTTKAVISRESVLSATKIASLFSKDNAPVVEFIFSPANGSVEVRSAKSDIGDNSTTLSAEVSGEEKSIAYNARFIIDFLSVIKNDSIVLLMNESLEPGAIQLPSDDNYVYVIMPIRT